MSLVTVDTAGAEIDGLVYDPLFAEAKNYYKYYGATYASYGLTAIRRVAI